MESTFLPFLLVIFASIFQGSFGVGMKYIAPLKWEAWWLVHVTVAMILFPLTWALIVVPGLFEIISSAPPTAISLAILFGFLWGIGGILFGVSIPHIGISLTYGIVMGLASSVGSLIPLFQIEGSASSPAFPYINAGVLVMLVGVAITAVAGIQRDKFKNEQDDQSKNIVDRVGGGDSFGAALIFALNKPELSHPPKAIRFAVASSCLCHSINGDFNYISRAEVESLMGGSALGRVIR